MKVKDEGHTKEELIQRVLEYEPAEDDERHAGWPSPLRRSKDVRDDVEYYKRLYPRWVRKPKHTS